MKGGTSGDALSFSKNEKIDVEGVDVSSKELFIYNLVVSYRGIIIDLA